MSSNSYCDPCSEDGKSIEAIKFCLDCKECLCEDCVDHHKVFRATRRHCLMSLTSISRSKIPIEDGYCKVHQDVPLDLYCTHHGTVCCKICISSNHQSCKDFLPLEVASKHIKKSSLFEDTLREWQNIGITLVHLRTARNENINELDSVETAILEDISKWKNQLISKIRTSEKKLKTDLSNIKEKTVDLLRKENSEISELCDFVQERTQVLEFLKEHGSNNQLYLTLREQGKGVQDIFKRAQDMTLSYKKADLKFKNKGNIKCIGSIEEVSKACGIQNSLVRPKQTQVPPARVESMFAFKLEILEKFQYGKLITGVAITEDNSLFLCDFQKTRDNLYVFKINPPNLTYKTTLSLPGAPYGISVLTETDKAIVTLPEKTFVQFINTTTLKRDKTIRVGKSCYGITTTGDYIAVGKKTEINILKSNGECIRIIVIGDLSKYISFLHYNLNDGSIIYRTMGLINRIQLDGTLVYSHAVAGEAGIAVDTQGNVYVSECYKSEIQRVLPDGREHDVVMRIKTPFAVAFNESFTKFAVTNITGLVQIYNCK